MGVHDHVRTNAEVAERHVFLVWEIDMEEEKEKEKKKRRR